MLMHCLECNTSFHPIPPNLSELRWHPSLRFCPNCYQFRNRLITFLPQQSTFTDNSEQLSNRCPECDRNFLPIPSSFAPFLDLHHSLIHYCSYCYNLHNHLVTRALPLFYAAINIDWSNYDSDSNSDILSDSEDEEKPISIYQYCFINPSGICNICLEDFKKEQVYRQLICTHNFHNDCISTWLTEKSTCPVCRTDCQ